MTGFTGKGFVGFIGCAPAFPTGHSCASNYNSGGATVTVTLGAPASVSLGDQMVACAGAGSYVGGTPWTLVPPSGWSTLYTTSETVDAVFTNLYAKTADQNDVDGLSSYTWTMTVAGGLAGMAVTHVSWPKRYGTTVSGASHDGTSTPSLSSPGGRWQLAFIYQRTANNFEQPNPDPVVTSAATLWCENLGTARPGNLRVYASDNVSPITGAYLTGGIDNPRQGLVVAAVS